MTRSEHDNLYGVVAKHGEALKRIETDLTRIFAHLGLKRNV